MNIPPPSKLDEAFASGNTRASADDVGKKTVRIGVLLVHGIGRQKEGETLVSFGEPLLHWFKEWFETHSIHKPKAEVHIADTLLSTSDLDPPSHTWLRIRRSDADPDVEILLCESHWADSFPLPRFGEVARWALLVLPWTIATQFAMKCRRLLADYCGRIRYYPLILLNGVVYIGGFFLSALVEVVVLALLLVSIVPIPWLRDFVVFLQLRIASIVGDSYVLLRSPVREDAIVSSVRRDVCWLEGQGCASVVLLGHSQGGAIAHRLVRAGASRSKELGRVELLFTFGSGLGKLNDIKENSNVLWLGWVVLIPTLVATLLLPGLIYLKLTQPQLTEQLPIWRNLLTVLAPFAAVGTLVFLGNRISKSRGTLIPAAPRLRWVDRYGSQDPVSSGPLLEEPRDSIDSEPVFNRHAVWSDHTTYWDNLDGFVSTVATELARIAGVPLARPEPESQERVRQSLREAGIRRRWRVWWLVGARLLIALNAVLTAYVLARHQQLELIGSKIETWLMLVIPGETMTLGSAVWQSYGSLIVGLLAVILVHVIWYQLIYRLWRWWNRWDTSVLFSCEAYDGGGVPFTLLLAASLVLPFITILLFSGRLASVVSGVAEFAAWPHAAHSALAITFIFAIFFGAFSWVLSFIYDEPKWMSGRLGRREKIQGAVSALRHMVAYFCMMLPGFLWLGFNRPNLIQAKPRDWMSSGLSTLCFLGLIILPGVIIWIWHVGVLKPAKRYLNAWRSEEPTQSAVWLAGLPARFKEWWIRQSVSGSLDSHPEIDPHSLLAGLTISLVAGLASVAASYAVNRAWIGTWGIIVFLILAMVTVLMGLSVRRRSEAKSLAWRISGVLILLPYFGLFIGDIMRWFPFTDGG